MSNEAPSIARPSEMQVVSTRFHMSPLAVRKTLIVTAFSLFALSLAMLGIKFVIGQFATDTGWFDRVVEFFHLDREKNLPSAFAALLLVGSAGGLGLIAVGESRSGGRNTRYWAALSLVFAFLALDEWNSFHEMLTEPLRSGLGTSGILHYAWIVLAIPAVAIGLFAFWKFLQSLPSETRRLFFLAALLFLGGALGMELLNGYIVSSTSAEAMEGSRPVTAGAYVFTTHVEELLEMLGAVTFVYALTLHIGRFLGRIEVHVR